MASSYQKKTLPGCDARGEIRQGSLPSQGRLLRRRPQAMPLIGGALKRGGNGPRGGDTKAGPKEDRSRGPPAFFLCGQVATFDASFILGYSLIREVIKVQEVVKQLKALRQATRWTQEELAGQLGVALRTLQRWEGGKTQPSDLSLRFLRHLEEKLGRRLSEQELIRRIFREVSRTLHAHSVTWPEEEIQALAERVYGLTKE